MIVQTKCTGSSITKINGVEFADDLYAGFFSLLFLFGKYAIYPYAACPHPSVLVEVLAAELMSISRRGTIALTDT